VDGKVAEQKNFRSMVGKTKPTRSHFVGVISDTHGLVRPEALRALQGVELILHAGDVGAPEVLTTLRTIAPVYPVRGNVDREDWARNLPKTQKIEVGGCMLYLLHDLHSLDLDPAAAGIRVVISGHSHHPSAVERNGVLYLNPGSAGPRRFRLPVSAAILKIEGDFLEARVVELKV
jgi:putative phosphoesterase